MNIRVVVYFMKQTLMKYGAIGGAWLLPALALAQFGQGNDEINTFLAGATAFIQTIIIPVLIAIAFLVFIFGAIRYFFVAGEGAEDSREQGRRLMFWGIIAFVVIVSVWGIVALIANGLGFGGNTQLDTIPNAPGAPAGGG